MNDPIMILQEEDILILKMTQNFILSSLIMKEKGIFIQEGKWSKQKCFQYNHIPILKSSEQKSDAWKVLLYFNYKCCFVYVVVSPMFLFTFHLPGKKKPTYYNNMAYTKD